MSGATLYVGMMYCHYNYRLHWCINKYEVSFIRSSTVYIPPKICTHQHAQSSELVVKQGDITAEVIEHLSTSCAECSSKTIAKPSFKCHNGSPSHVTHGASENSDISHGASEN